MSRQKGSGVKKGAPSDPIYRLDAGRRQSPCGWGSVCWLDGVRDDTVAPPWSGGAVSRSAHSFVNLFHRSRRKLPVLRHPA